MKYFGQYSRNIDRFNISLDLFPTLEIFRLVVLLKAISEVYGLKASTPTKAIRNLLGKTMPLSSLTEEAFSSPLKISLTYSYS